MLFSRAGFITTMCCICDKTDLENIYEVLSLGSLWLKFLFAQMGWTKIILLLISFFFLLLYWILLCRSIYSFVTRILLLDNLFLVSKQESDQEFHQQLWLLLEQKLIFVTLFFFLPVLGQMYRPTTVTKETKVFTE